LGMVFLGLVTAFARIIFGMCVCVCVCVCVF